MTKNETRDWIGESMKAKGFHDDMGDFAVENMMRVFLVDTENVEAGQEVKRHWGDSVTDEVRDKIAKECADTAIRMYDFAYLCGIDLDSAFSVGFKPIKDIGKNERQSLLIRCGKIMSILGRIFDALESLYETGGTDSDKQVLFKTKKHFSAFHVSNIATALFHCEELCKKVGRDLSVAIETKMQENMARPHKYGTPEAEKPKTQSVSPNVGDLQVLIHFEDGLLDESKLKELLDKCKDNRVQRDLPKSKLDVRELVRLHGMGAILASLVEFVDSELKFYNKQFLLDLRDGLHNVMTQFESRPEEITWKTK